MQPISPATPVTSLWLAGSLSEAETVLDRINTSVYDLLQPARGISEAQFLGYVSAVWHC